MEYTLRDVFPRRDWVQERHLFENLTQRWWILASKIQPPGGGRWHLLINGWCWVHHRQVVYKEAVTSLDSKTNRIQHLILWWLIASMKEFSFLISVLEGAKFSFITGCYNVEHHLRLFCNIISELRPWSLLLEIPVTS